MKLSSKWIICFVFVSLYAAILGGLFYYNMFKFVFDTKLQNEMVEMVRYRAPLLVEGLVSRPRNDATFKEAELLKEWKRGDERIRSLVYFNDDLTVRWHENTQFLRQAYDVYNNEVGLDTNVAKLALLDRTPKAVMFDEGNFYDMAIPLLAKDEVAGIVNLTVSRADAKALIRQSMVRYALGAFMMIVIIGGALYLFLLIKIIRPLDSLRDSVEAVSLNRLNLEYPERGDEIGDVAVSITILLDKIKEEIKSMENMEIMSLEKEQKWWKSILAVTVPRNSRALVIDENNNILYTNFELNINKKGPVHLLDIFDGRQQNIIQVVGEALEHPGRVLRGNVVSKDVKCTVKAVQLPDDAGKNRMLLVLEPEKSL
ncbi:MAG: hypothetical protein J6U96_02325 [Elusimicrobiaceae bacterium]|nr:hypothetical protein [Elusimicrobiaceae bacterium]